MNKKVGVSVFLLLSFLLFLKSAYGDSVYSEDFESGLGDWSVDNGVWDAGVPGSGPSDCYQGSVCAGTALDGNYPGNTDSRLISPPIQLPSLAADEKLYLSFWQWFSYAGCDSGFVQISVWDPKALTWSDWINLGEAIVDSSLWSRRLDEVTSYANKIVRIGFYHTATTGSYTCDPSSSGWYLDNIEVISQEPAFTGGFENGWDFWSADRGVWQVGVPSAGPLDCHDGVACVGTVLGGNYPGNTDSRLISPPIQLPSLAADEKLYLSFWQWFAYAGCDSGLVQISVWDSKALTWSDWINLGEAIVDSSPWSRRLDEVTSYANKIVRIGFYHTAKTGSYTCDPSSSGWYVDNIEVISQEPAFTGGFENGWDFWSADRGVWQVGVPSAGPLECHDGVACVGTVLGGNYPGNTDSRLISPPIQLQNHFDIFRQEPSLRFWHWFSFAGCDQGVVQISVWSPDLASWSEWENIGNPIIGSSPQWTSGRIELYAYTGAIVRLAFFHNANTGSYTCDPSSTGWYLDDIRLPGVFLEPCEFDFDNDGDVDSSDLNRFSQNFGDRDCSATNFCYADYDKDGDVDGTDLRILSEDFGERACFSPIP